MLLLENKKDLENAAEVCDYALRLHIDYIDERLVIDGRDVEDLLHSDMVDRHVAQLSAIPELRSIVNEKIRAITKSQSIVCEGRDMTTVVFPDADYKFYLDASLDVQAQRRFDQGVSDLSLEEIKETIRKRDLIDKEKVLVH